MSEHLIFVPEPLHPDATERIASLAPVVTRIEEASAATIAIVRNYRVDAAAVNRMPRLGLVVKHGAGIDRIDTGLLAQRGVELRTTPGHNANGVSELAVLQGMRLLRTADEPGAGLRAREMSGRRAAVLGLGRVGFGIARILAGGFGMEVRAFDPYATRCPESVEQVPTAAEAVAEADLLFVSCPLTPDTRGMVDDALLAGMSAHAVVVNTARAAVADNASMTRALNAGRIRAYAHDFAGEPEAFDGAVERGEVLATGHIGGATEEALLRTGAAVVEIVGDAVAGRAELSDQRA